jgi:galactosylceramidase
MQGFYGTIAALGLGLLGAVQPAIAQDAAVTALHLDGKATGATFEGIGIVDGGGATSVLLKDYPDPQRQQILDLVYKPKFGASVSALYVEMPGDGNSTQGSMPSHMHTRDDLNYGRGYIWWVMTEARRRNPRLSLDGAAWSAPGWVGDRGARYGHADEPFFSQDGVDYYISWLRGLRDVHGLTLDAIGIRNEKGVSYEFAKAMRRVLNANGFATVRLHGFDNWQDDRFDFVRDMARDESLRAALDIASAHVSPVEGTKVSPEVQHLAAQMGKPLWNTEQHVYQAGYEGLLSTVRSFNEGHIADGFTKIVDWYGIGGLYTLEPYSGEKEALVRANWPWSGRYLINPKLWAYAHYGQFTEIGWTYLAGGSGRLRGGGTFVALKSPGNDYSIVMETADAKATQSVRIDALNLASGPLAVWRSTAADQFVRQPDVVLSNGVATIRLEPRAVYSFTTTRGQQKGDFGAVPDARPFPFPYRETFDEYVAPARWGYLPRYFADIYGAFELARCPQRKGICLHQAAPSRPISWAPGWLPYTIIGDDQWRDYAVSADVYLKPGEAGGVMGRVNNVGTGYGSDPKGYILRLSSAGEVSIVVVRGKVDKKKPVGDAVQQAIIKSSADTGEGGEKTLATTRFAAMGTGGWHRLKLQMQGSSLTGFVDGKPVVKASDTLFRSGMAGLQADASERTMSMPFFDEIELAAVGGRAPHVAASRSAAKPIYPRAR